jgi:hypothetical protein
LFDENEMVREDGVYCKSVYRLGSSLDRLRLRLGLR